MSNINQSGTYRGNVVDRGMGQSSGGFPQLLLSLQATEKYDEQNEVWTPWDYEEVDIQAYLVLFGGNGKPTMNVRQAMQALGWDGTSFQTLQDSKDLATQIQFRVAESAYEGITRLKVEWINAYDADPRRSVAKLEVGDIKKLDAQYAAALKALGGGPKPKSAKPAAPAAPVADPTPVAPTGSLATPPGPQSTSVLPTDPAPAPADPAPKKRGRPAAPKTPPVAVPSVTPTTPTSEPLDQAGAWDVVTTRGGKGSKTDPEVTSTWTCVVKELGGDEKVGADWSGVATEVCKRLGV
jgi:hypothetical protein